MCVCVAVFGTHSHVETRHMSYVYIQYSFTLYEDVQISTYTYMYNELSMCAHTESWQKSALERMASWLRPWGVMSRIQPERFLTEPYIPSQTKTRTLHRKTM